MQVITLTTDMGNAGYYVAAIKGRIYSELGSSSIKIEDISHDIRPFDLLSASFVLKNAFHHFPQKSIHIIGIDTERTFEKPHLLVEYKNHYFIGTDNGFFSLFLDYQAENVYEINLQTESTTFSSLNVFVPAACHLARGGTPEIIAKPSQIKNIKQSFQPLVGEFGIKGYVAFIDNYGSIITNITQDLFQNAVKGRKYSILFKRMNYDLKIINHSYHEQEEGLMMAVFNDAGYMEIVVNRGVDGYGGSAQQLFGLKVNDTILIEFRGE